MTDISIKFPKVSGGGGAPSGPAGGDLAGTYPNPTVPGLVVLQDQIDEINEVITPIMGGNIFSDNFNRADSASLGPDWTQSGTTLSIVSNKMQYSSASGSIAFTNKAAYTALGNSNLENNEITGILTLPSVFNATSFGAGIGYSSTAVQSQELQIRFCTETANQGKIIFYYDKNTGSSFNKTSTGILPVTAGEVTTVSLIMKKDSVSVTWANSSGVSITEVYQFFFSRPSQIALRPSAWNVTVYSFGGTGTFEDISFTSKEILQADRMYVTDSIDAGYSVGDVDKRPIDILSSNYIGTTICYGNPNARVADFNAKEIAKHRPKMIIISAGINDARAGTNAAGLITKYNTLLSNLNIEGAVYGDTYTMGVNVKINTLIPTNLADITTHNASIRSTYNNGFIEQFYSFWSGTSFTINPLLYNEDTLHINALGAIVKANIQATNLGLQLKPYSKGSLFHFVKSALGFLGLGVNNYDPQTMLDVVSTTSAIRISSSTAQAEDKAGYIVAINSAGAVNYSWGGYYNGSQWVAKDTTYSSISITGGQVVFFSNTGLTIGNTFTPTERGRFDVNGLSLSQIGEGLRIKEGANARMGVATLSSGSVTVNNTSVTANTRIFYSIQETGTLTGTLRVTAKVVGTSFTLATGLPGDNAVIAWELKEGI